MTAAAVEVRVSTQRQAQAQTIEQQLGRLRAHLGSQGVELASETFFRDDGYSGATLNRSGPDRLRDAVRAGEVEQVLVTAPDRPPGAQLRPADGALGRARALRLRGHLPGPADGAGPAGPAAPADRSAVPWPSTGAR